MYKSEVFQANKGFKAAMFESYFETVFGKPAR